MTECYWLALARDVPYSRYGQEPITAAAITDLRAFADHRDLDARTLFRATDPQLPGITTGPYVSQGLLQPYPLGSTSHRDFSYQGPLVAALILLGYLARYGPEVLADTNPYREHLTQTGGVTFGAPDILDQVARSANAAVKAAWYHKWLVHRRLRPEEAGGRIHHHLTGAATYPFHRKLTNSVVLGAAVRHPRQLPVPLSLPRGLPDPPRLPRRHRRHRRGRGAGAQGDVQPQLRDPRAGGASDDGLSLRPWRGEPLTVGGELNKLAFNMAFGRDTAGVHFRRDEVEGILL